MKVNKDSWLGGLSDRRINGVPEATASPPGHVPVLDLREVTWIRKGEKILDGITWKIEKGERWVLFGPNGSGKTTLLRIMAGFLHPTSGVVRVLGERLGRTDLAVLKRKIGWVSTYVEKLIHFEDPAMEIIAAGHFAGTRLWQRIPESAWNKARMLVTLVGCDAVREKPYGVLSQGEQKRILIARALMVEPDLLVLDEPCAGLDMAAREMFLHVLDDLVARYPGLAIVHATHHVEEVTPIHDKVFLIKDGRGVLQGKREDVLVAGNLSNLFGIQVEIERKGDRLYSFCRQSRDDRINPARG